MGIIASRRHDGVEELDMVAHNAYRYPPKSGNYFAGHFLMGGERFDTIQPEMYLFGENQDLNFLGSRPVPFPYPINQSNEPSRTLKSLINIRKDSLRFVKVQDCESDPKSDTKKPTVKEDTRYNIEFTFDSDVPCAITIYYFATEDFSNGQLSYHSRDSTLTSDTFHYKRGANQTFSQTSHVVDPSKHSEDEWLYHAERDILPVVVHCVVDDDEQRAHSHATFGVVEITSDSGYSLKPLKQKQAVDGLAYLIQEIYGIENKNNERSKVEHEDEFEDNSSECVICMCEMRDTLILPCRHLCLCSCCANNLRYQANNCPICRAPFRALLQIRTLRKKGAYPAYVQNEEDLPVTHDGIPQGYESTSLMEALNGPIHALHVNLPPEGLLNQNPLHVNLPPEGLLNQNPLHVNLPPEVLPTTIRPTLLNSPNSSPEMGKLHSMAKPHQSISDMSLRDAAAPDSVAVSKETGEPADVKLALNPCALLARQDGSSSAPTDTTSNFDGDDLKASSELSMDVDESDETRSDSLSASVPSVEIINELNSARKMIRAEAGRRMDILSSPRYRRPHSDLDMPYVRENDSDDVDERCVSLDLTAAADAEVMVYSKSARTDEPTTDQETADDLADDMALPGTPSNNDNSSGSSYGSTSSTKMLLQDPLTCRVDDSSSSSPVNYSSEEA